MTNKDAFIFGVRSFCKSAGFDADDSEQVERLLLMPAEEAKPIVKAAQVTMHKVSYFRAGEKLAGINIEEVMAEAKNRIKDPKDWESVRNWAGQQAQQAMLQKADAGAQGATGAWGQKSMKGVGSMAGGGVKDVIKDLAKKEDTTTEDKAPVSDADKAKAKKDAEMEKYKTQFEASPYKDDGMSLSMYASLKGQYDAAATETGAIIPENAFIGGRWSSTKRKIATRESKRSLRDLGLDLAPGQLAAMSDADLQSRFTDPGEQAAMRQARDLAKRREQRMGGPQARMGGGFGTQTPTAPAQPAPPTSTAPVTSTSATPPAPAPSSVPQTSGSPPPVNGNTTPVTSTSPSPPKPPTDMDVANKFSTSDWQKAKLSGGSVEVGLPSGGKLTSGLS